AAERNVRDRDAGSLEKLLHRKMWNRERALVPVVERARPLLCHRHEIADGLDRRIGPHRERHGVGESLADRLEYIGLISGVGTARLRIDRKHQRWREQER